MTDEQVDYAAEALREVLAELSPTAAGDGLPSQVPGR